MDSDRLAYERAMHLGDLYEQLQVLLEDEGCIPREELARLTQQYGSDNIKWMLQVLADDANGGS